jgi:hypothetical protein
VASAGHRALENGQRDRGRDQKRGHPWSTPLRTLGVLLSLNFIGSSAGRMRSGSQAAFRRLSFSPSAGLPRRCCSGTRTEPLARKHCRPMASRRTDPRQLSKTCNGVLQLQRMDSAVGAVVPDEFVRDQLRSLSIPSRTNRPPSGLAS